MVSFSKPKRQVLFHRFKKYLQTIFCHGGNVGNSTMFHFRYITGAYKIQIILGQHS